MDTNQLILRLAASTTAVPPRATENRIAGALAVGASTSLALITIVLGSPLGGLLGLEVMTIGVKLGFALSTMLIAAVLLARAARPGGQPSARLGWLLVPAVLLSVLAVAAIAKSPAEARSDLVFGGTWLFCMAAVSLLALPVFGALLFAFRQFAPTDLEQAGLLSGVTAGSTAAFAYALHCGETSPAFLLLWYGSAILGTGAFGRLAGPSLLRW